MKKEIKKAIIIVFANMLAIPLYYVLVATVSVSHFYFSKGWWQKEVMIYGFPAFVTMCVMISIFLIHYHKESFAVFLGVLPIATSIITISCMWLF